MKVLIGCGKSKSPSAAPAFKLYTGGYFQATWRWASSIAPVDNIRIVSAKHGLLHPLTRVEPYDLKMAPRSGISAATLSRQLAELGDDDLIGVLGSEYRRRLLQAGARCRYPFTDAFPGAGMGTLRKELASSIGFIP